MKSRLLNRCLRHAFLPAILRIATVAAVIQSTQNVVNSRNDVLVYAPCAVFVNFYNCTEGRSDRPLLDPLFAVRLALSLVTKHNRFDTSNQRIQCRIAHKLCQAGAMCSGKKHHTLICYSPRRGLGRETHAEWVGDQASNYRWSRTLPGKKLKASRGQEPTSLCSMFSNTAHTKTYPSDLRCHRSPVPHIASKTESLEIVALSSKWTLRMPSVRIRKKQHAAPA